MAFIMSIVMMITMSTAISDGEQMTVKAKSLHNKKACWISYQDIHDELKDKSEDIHKIILLLCIFDIFYHKKEFCSSNLL